MGLLLLVPEVLLLDFGFMDGLPLMEAAFILID